jgi:hypothetical protein
MDERPYSSPPSASIDAGDHLSVRAAIPEYTLARALGHTLHPAWEPLEAHLAACVACRQEADELLAMVSSAYDGDLRAVSAPPPNLAFLARRFEPLAAAGARLRRVVVQFSEALVPQMRVAMAARQAGSHLRYSYRVEPAHADEPELTIEVFEYDDRPGLGFLQVTVEPPDADPFDVPPCRLALEVAGERHEATTNQHGVVIVHGLALEQLGGWRIAVAPADGP